MTPLVLDPGPLIYLANLEALDALPAAKRDGVVPPSVYTETARPQLSFRHPEVAVIDRALTDGLFRIQALSEAEQQLAATLGTRSSGLHAGELDVLALGTSRGWDVCLHERQAARLARALGVATFHVVEVLFAGTADPEELEARIRSFARLTNLAMDDLDQLLKLITERRT
jgi:predicted nucleic acid-binding protein